MSTVESIKKFGTPKFGGGNGYKNFRIKENEANVYRLIPPIKTGIDDGRWAVFLAQHFGYAGVDQADKSKTKVRPFACPKKENFATKMVTVACPECDKIGAQKELLANKEQTLKAEGRTDEEIDQMTAHLKAWCRNHNQDRKWYINVMSQQGELGNLAIAHKSKQALEALIKKLTEDGIDPFDVTAGVWFDFRRTGRGNQTNHTVFVLEDTIKEGNRTFKEIKTAPLTEAQQDKALEVLPDLTVNNLMRVLSVDQIHSLATGSGDPEFVDQVFALSQKAESSPSPKPASKPAPEAPAEKKVDKKAASAPEKKPTPPVEVDEEAQLQAALNAARAKKAARLAAAQQKAPDNEVELDTLFPEKA